MAYADPILNADLEAAIRDIEGLEANTIVIQGKPYPVVLNVATTQQSFENGGPMREMIRLVASLRKSLFSQPPVVGNLPVTARNTQWRIMEVNITSETYELVLETPKK